MEAASGTENLLSSPAIRYALITVLLAAPAMSVELFRYRGCRKDNGTLEYVFEIDEEEVSKTMTEAKAAEIAADLMTMFNHNQIGALEAQRFRTTPVPFWLFCFSDTAKGQIVFSVLINLA